MASLNATETSEPITRRLTFSWTGVDVDDWHPELPEFASGANAISLLMPHAEPYVINVVRSAARSIDDDSLIDSVESWAAQEATHFRAHRRFNKELIRKSMTARTLDRFGAWMFRMLRKRSAAFGVAFAAAFEIIAFSSARWAEAGLRQYFSGADERSASLFLWHLAEEVEHKGVAHDVLDAVPGARRRYPLALIAAFMALIGFTVVGGLALFARRRHAFNPSRWLRLIRWGFSLAFVLLPLLAASLSKSFHPNALVDPPWMRMWLSEYDPHSETLPLWTDAGRAIPIS